MVSLPTVVGQGLDSKTEQVIVQALFYSPVFFLLSLKLSVPWLEAALKIGEHFVKDPSEGLEDEKLIFSTRENQAFPTCGGYGRTSTTEQPYREDQRKSPREALCHRESTSSPPEWWPSGNIISYFVIALLRRRPMSRISKLIAEDSTWMQGQ
jgi:hypothetical protein